ncbi:MAG TPA: rhomboid family intramembrane serine protease [archaeon]|nr:rhomboid family intramembrane serine protease [archaeon]
MRYNTYYEQASLGFAGKFTRGVKYLIIVCTASFLVGTFFELAHSAFWIDAFGLTPRMIKKYFMIWQPVTFMFLHGNLWHLLFNMFALWMFGSELERTWGTREFLVFFFITGLCTGLLYLIFASGLPLIIKSGSQYQTLIGSSGAIFAILAAYGLSFPDRTILFMFLFPIKAKWFVLLIAAIELYLSWVPSGVSHFAHLSGMLIGYIYLKKDWNFSRVLDNYYDRQRRKRIKLVEEEKLTVQRERNEVDRILDKINAQGIQSLTRKEMKILQKASERKNKG